MRKPMIAGNWKMNETPTEARELIREMREPLEAIREVDRVLCPPFVDLPTAAAELEETGIELGAQNMHHEASGAYTGEISPLMLKELCERVILGHSERRQYFGEDDELINRKVKAALAHGLKPILCIGETLQEREGGRTEQVLVRQIEGGLAGLDPGELGPLVIAYEPVWAIGTGRAATGANIDRVVEATIREAVRRGWGQEVAEGLRVLYGGSVNPSNVEEFMEQPNLDGALVGGASLKATDFIAIAKSAARFASG